MHALDDAPWTWQSQWNKDMPDFFQGMPNGVYDNIYEDLDDSPVSFHITEVIVGVLYAVTYHSGLRLSTTFYNFHSNVQNDLRFSAEFRWLLSDVFLHIFPYFHFCLCGVLHSVKFNMYYV
jgi:hypothetical protein